MIRLALSLYLVVAQVCGFSMPGNRVFVSTPASKFPKRLVGDCMDPVVHVLTPDMSIDETLKVFIRHNLSAAPVVDENKNLVGIVSSFDFLQKEAFEGALLPLGGTQQNVEKYVDAAKKICGQKVEDVMSELIHTVTVTTSMRQAAALMSEMKLHRLPVLDSKGELVGILTAADVMKDLLHVYNMLPAAEEKKEDDKSSP